MSGYTKLFGSILQSTVWQEPLPTKVVWITMLALSDRDGIVSASVPGLARAAGVERADCDRALASFLAPDPDSSTKDYEGRRIEAVRGGWRLLNFEFYRDLKSPDQLREEAAERQRRKRDRDRGQDQSRDVTTVTRSHARSRKVTQSHPSDQAQAQAQTRSDQKEAESSEPAKPPTSEPPFLTFPCNGKIKTWDLTTTQVSEWRPLYPAVDVPEECRKALAWTNANPRKRKTAGGMPAFLVNWLGRSQNRGTANTEPPSSGIVLRPMPL